MKSQFCAVLSVVISLYVKMMSLFVLLCTVYSCVIISSVPVHLLLVEETMHMSLELPLLSLLIPTATSVLQSAPVPTRSFF